MVVTCRPDCVRGQTRNEFVDMLMKKRQQQQETLVKTVHVLKSFLCSCLALVFRQRFFGTSQLTTEVNAVKVFPAEAF